MSVNVLEKPLELDKAPWPALRTVDSPSAFAAAAPVQADFQIWELHSELVFVDSELRRRSLELLPEPASDVLAKRPRPVIVVPALADEPALPHYGILRYAVRRVGEMTRFGLAIVGTIFTLAMLAEVLSR
jgi:uncharacterized protein (DUF2252 family)